MNFMKALMFSTSFGESKLILPTMAWTLPPLSLRNSTLPALYSPTTLADIRRDRAGTRTGHQTTRTEHTTERSDQSHHVGSGDADIKIGPAIFDLLGQVILADFVRTRFFGCLGGVAFGEHDDSLGLANAVGKYQDCHG